MTEPTFAAFQAEHLAQGFDEVLERVWQPDLSVATHTHPFEVKAQVVAVSRQAAVTYKQKLDERAGEAEFNKMTPHRALRYPFAILSDPSGSRGHAWLQSLLAGSR